MIPELGPARPEDALASPGYCTTRPMSNEYRPLYQFMTGRDTVRLPAVARKRSAMGDHGSTPRPVARWLRHVGTRTDGCPGQCAVSVKIGSKPGMSQSVSSP